MPSLPSRHWESALLFECEAQDPTSSSALLTLVLSESRRGNEANGLSGLMVPMINTAEEAAQVVAYSKFPPQGLRGQGSAFPAIGHGLTTPEYMQSANQTILTVVQIETRQGVENVEEIAAVDGIGEIIPVTMS